jgi:hypothetical protein
MKTNDKPKKDQKKNKIETQIKSSLKRPIKAFPKDRHEIRKIK